MRVPGHEGIGVSPCFETQFLSRESLLTLS